MTIIKGVFVVLQGDQRHCEWYYGFILHQGLCIGSVESSDSGPYCVRNNFDGWDCEDWFEILFSSVPSKNYQDMEKSSKKSELYINTFFCIIEDAEGYFCHLYRSPPWYKDKEKKSKRVNHWAHKVTWLALSIYLIFCIPAWPEPFFTLIRKHLPPNWWHLDQELKTVDLVDIMQWPLVIFHIEASRKYDNVLQIIMSFIVTWAITLSTFFLISQLLYCTDLRQLRQTEERCKGTSFCPKYSLLSRQTWRLQYKMAGYCYEYTIDWLTPKATSQVQIVDIDTWYNIPVAFVKKRFNHLDNWAWEWA